MYENKSPFNVLNSETPVDLNERIEQMINSSDLFLFMKGTPYAPACGFSSNVVGILNTIKAEFKFFDILSDENIRQGVKEYSNWPTYPQLFCKGKLLGGNDIISEMFEAGDLQKHLLKDNP